MSCSFYVLVVIILFKTNSILCERPKIECGYKQCPQTREGALNVHLIPHSHMDAGWVKTFDQYYFGTQTSISTANVQLIYHSVLSELLHDNRRKFTLSETAYFWRWWKEQRPNTRATFRSLVQEGRLEFAGGGWVSNDEATPDYLQIIDQYTWGLRKINDTIGPCGKPKAAWQIDTYGHSREQVSLLAQMGFDGLFIGRVDHKEREGMIDEDRMEFMWRGSDVLGKMSDIMTHTLFNLYNAPEGFCFDFLCSDEPIIDDSDNKVYNADKRVNDFISQIERQARYYDHDNILVTMGGDFTYQSAANWFINMDKLINHVNTHPANISDINIFYSTPSCYLKAIYLYGKRDKAIFTEKNDYLPYGSDLATYWTGYYSSRPSLKYLVRRAHVFLQVVKQLHVLGKLGDSFELHLLRHAVSLLTHHDAMTGTSQQHVTNDFIKIITEAIDACSKKVSSILSLLTPTWGGNRRKNAQQFVVCHQLNMSQCKFTETQESVLLLVYNPLPIKTYHHIKLPAIALHYSVRDFNDEEIEYQLLPLPAAIINLPGRSSTAIQELCFEAENIPSLGFTAFYISPVRDVLEENEFHKKRSTGQAEAEQEIIPFLSNEYLKVAVDKTTGLLESITHVDGFKVSISQNFYFYSQSQQPLQSGAYSFRPDKPRPVPVSEKVAFHTIRGSLVKEIRQTFSDWVTQIIRLYRGEEYVELEWIIGPVPIGADLGKEVVSLFTTNITNKGQFYTDSNSRQMMKRSCWNETITHQEKKPIAACYYPVTSRICIQSSNDSVGMCVLTDRTQGGTSYNDGEVELMVHRRLLTDDGFGLEETLNEEAYRVGLVIRGKHRILFGNYKQEVDDLNFFERMSQTARRWMYEPWLFFTSGEKLNRRKWQTVRNKRFSALKLHGLPRHIHVLTLEPWKAGSVLLRLENTLESPIRERFKTDVKGEGPEDFQSKASYITVELRKIFLQMPIRMVRETTLAANQWLEDARQMDWSTRYVYPGADDGILPEDVEDIKEKPSKQIEEQQDSGHYSDEDQELKRRKDSRRQKSYSKIRLRPKTPFHEDRDREFERKKRSSEVTDNVTTNYTSTNYKVNETTTLVDEDTTFVRATTKRNVITKDDYNFGIPITQKTPKLNFFNRRKPSRTQEYGAEDLNSSEEDSSFNQRIKSQRRRNRVTVAPRRKEEEPVVVDADDGITKSMYDMYYRQRKPPTQHKKEPHTRHSKEERSKKIIRRNKHRGVYYDEVTESTTGIYRQNKMRKTVAEDPSFVFKIPTYTRRHKGGQRKMRQKIVIDDALKETIKSWAPRTRRKGDIGTETDYSGEEELDDRERELTEIRSEHYRRKRTLTRRDEQIPDSPENIEEPEYVVTLRPTQIRTFIIWFETNKQYSPGK